MASGGVARRTSGLTFAAFALHLLSTDASIVKVLFALLRQFYETQIFICLIGGTLLGVGIAYLTENRF